MWGKHLICTWIALFLHLPGSLCAGFLPIARPQPQTWPECSSDSLHGGSVLCVAMVRLGLCKVLCLYVLHWGQRFPAEPAGLLEENKWVKNNKLVIHFSFYQVVRKFVCIVCIFIIWKAYLNLACQNWLFWDFKSNTLNQRVKLENPDLKTDGEISYSLGSQGILSHCWCSVKSNNVIRVTVSIYPLQEGHKHGRM